jgi:hypothetical protein
VNDINGLGQRLRTPRGLTGAGRKRLPIDQKEMKNP